MVLLYYKQQVEYMTTNLTLDEKLVEESEFNTIYLNNKLKKSNLELQDSLRSKDEFAAMINHELKTQLVPILGYAQLLMKSKLGKMSSEQLACITEIYNSAQFLKGLIENLLTASKLGMHKMHYTIETISLNEFLKTIYNNHVLLMEEKKIDFSCEKVSDLKIRVDKKRLTEVFTNIIQNAVDFVPNNGGKISILVEDQEEYVVFQVKDNGSGIKKEEQEHLFKKFYQIDTSITRKHGGSGLGLAICKGIMEDMGGKIWVKSNPGQETVFYFSLPKSVV